MILLSLGLEKEGGGGNQKDYAIIAWIYHIKSKSTIKFFTKLVREMGKKEKEINLSRKEERNRRNQKTNQQGK